MIQGNYLYKDYFNDLAKLYGSVNNAVVSADSWIYYQNNFTTVTTGNYADLLSPSGPTLGPSRPTSNRCLFHGNFIVQVWCQFYALPGGLVLFENNCNTTDSFQIGSVNNVAAGTFVNGAPVLPYSSYFIHADTTFGNYISAEATGVGNTYRVVIKFDGVRITW